MASAPNNDGLDFIDLMPKVARRLLGKPSSSSSTEIRYGTNGSLSIDLTKGSFYDHENKAGSGVLDLIIRERGGDLADAFRWLEAEGLKEPSEGGETAEQKIDDLRQKMAGSRVFYDYTDAAGTVLFRVERIEQNGSKTFRQHGPDGKNGFHSVKGCMQNVQRVPYRLHELAAAESNRVVFVVEGEKDADRLASLGFAATTNSQGAGAFGAELATHFAGRRVVVIPDNDQAGSDHAVDVVGKLRSVAAAITVLRLAGLADKEDVSDWLDAGNTSEELKRLAIDALANPDLSTLAFRDKPPTEPEELPFIDAGDLAGHEVPPREWQADGWEPRRSCVLVTGLGASGKSLLYQQRVTCAAVGADFLGIAVNLAVALYISCEDDISELHRRQKAINDSLGITWADLRGKLFLVSLKGMQNNELCTFDQSGRMHTTPRWRSLLALVHKVGARQIVLDNSAHLFAGNEIVRNHVAAFIGLLDRLAVEIDGGVILLGHPNKDGAEYSGSTAWENQVRSRIYLSLAEPDASGAVDPDARRLTNSKPNYSRRGDAVDFVWYQWAFVRLGDIPANAAAEMSATIEQTADNTRFLACLTKASEDHRAVSHTPGTNYAPKIFAQMTEARGVSAKRFARALERLLHIGVIRLDQPLWRGPNRVMKQGIKLASECTDPPALTPCTDPHAPPSQVVDFPCTELHASTPLGITYHNGATPGAAAPFQAEQDDDPAADEFRRAV